MCNWTLHCYWIAMKIMKYCSSCMIRVQGLSPTYGQCGPLYSAINDVLYSNSLRTMSISIAAFNWTFKLCSVSLADFRLPAPHKFDPLTDRQNCHRWLHRRPLPNPNLVQIRPRGLLDTCVKYKQFFKKYLYPFLGTHLYTDKTDRRVFALDGSNDANWHKDVPFGVFVDIAAHLWVQILQKPLFWSMNRRFQVKCAKYSNFHIIKTTVLITSKFCTVIKTTKYMYLSWVVQIRPNKSNMADSRHLEK